MFIHVYYGCVSRTHIKWGNMTTLGFLMPTQIAFLACLIYIGHVLFELRASVEQRISFYLCHMLLPPTTWTGTFVGQRNFDLNTTCQLRFVNFMQLVSLFDDSQWTYNHKFEVIRLETRGSYSISNLPLHFKKKKPS